ncbi:hypothetical protein AB0C38_11255 [Amycolatopsis sp. NPDC048633]|uniref:hypothetical protein n=1 Tax=Amycolatopsis sp. NPDC048633 TaxID=3157095 RepID=UPI0033ED9F69
MTAAVIYLDPIMLNPVIEGVWHHARLAGIPDPGESITMLCGATGVASFLPLGQRRNRSVPRQCDSCDVVVRRQRGIPLRQSRIGHS